MKEINNRTSLRKITRSVIDNLNKAKKKTLEEYKLTPGKKLKSKINKVDNVKSKINKTNNVKSKINKANNVKSKINKANNVKSKYNKARNVKSIEEQEISSSKVQQKQIEEIVDVKQKTQELKVEESSESPNTHLSRKRKRTNSESQELCKPFNPKILSKESIRECISVICKLIKTELKDKNELLPQEAKPIFIQITCVKIPSHPPCRMKLLLPHSMILAEDEVALFVPDLEKKKRKDYEITIKHYKKLLEANNCRQISKIIPLYQARTEYGVFELKRKLAASCDHFLVDGRISGRISRFTGKAFHVKRKTPIPLRITSKNLKREIDHAFKKTVLHIHSFGDTQCVQVGTTLMKKKEILQNVIATCNYLWDHYPGSWKNIRALRLRGDNTIALPIYLTLKNKNTVDQPVVKPKRPKAYRDVEDEVMGKIVTVKPEGDIIVKTMQKKEKKK